MRRTIVIALGSLTFVACTSNPQGGTSGAVTTSGGASSATTTGGGSTATTGGTTGGCGLYLIKPTPIQGDGGESVTFTASQVTNGIATVELHTNCAAVGTQVQFDSTPSGGQAQTQDAGTDDGGDVSFDLTGLVNKSMGTFTANIVGGAALPEISYDVILFTITPPPGNLLVVAAQDNLVLDEAGTDSLAVDGGTIIANEPECTTTACAAFTISGISGLGPVDGSGNVGTATLTLNFPGQQTNNPNPIHVANGSTSVTFSAVSMPAVSYPTAGTVTLTLTDNAGDTTTETWDVTTDILHPNAPTLSAAMSDKRTASVILSWTVPPTGGDSATQGYELAYVINDLNATPPVIPSEATYASWTLDPTIFGLNGAVGANLTYTETNLPTLNQYTFELRAIDEVGNLSALAADATAVSISAFDPNSWQTLTITENDGNEANSDFGYVLRTGDFNADGKQDLVITAPYQYAANPTPGVVFIMNGADDLSEVTFAGLTSITLGGTAYDWFGQDAHVADYNGDGVDDLAVGSPEYNNGQGRVDIFFGSNPGGLPSSPSTTILGDTTQLGLFGYSVSAVDVDGDGIQDLLVGAPAMGASGNGASYLFLGSKMAWPNPDAGANVTSATSVITGNAGDGLGARWGSVAIGDINGDGDGDYTVSAPGGGGSDGLHAGPGSLYGFSGATALANATMTVSANALFTLTGPGNSICDPKNYGYASGGGDEAFTFWGCFGVNAIAANFTENTNGLSDLVVGSVYESEAYLFTMGKSGPNLPDVASMSGMEALGWSMVALDINEDGHPDLMSGQNSAATPNVFFYLNNGAGLAPQPSGEILGPAGGYFGFGLAAGDLQGIGKPDFAVSDIYPSAYVNIYH